MKEKFKGKSAEEDEEGLGKQKMDTEKNYYFLIFTSFY
jgi:hypothetical protein